MGGTLLSERVGSIGGLLGGYRVADSVRRLAPFAFDFKGMPTLHEAHRSRPDNFLKII